MQHQRQGHRGPGAHGRPRARHHDPLGFDQAGQARARDLFDCGGGPAVAEQHVMGRAEGDDPLLKRLDLGPLVDVLQGLADEHLGDGQAVLKPVPQFVVQHLQIGARPDGGGGLDHGVDHPGDRTVRQADGAVAEGEPRLLRFAPAVDDEREVLDEGRLSAIGAARDGADFVPGLGPNVGERAAERLGLVPQDRRKASL